MTVGIAWPGNWGACEQSALWANALPQRVVAGATLACLAATCALALCLDVGDAGRNGVAPRADRLAFAASRSDRLAITRLPAVVRVDLNAFDARFSAAFPALQSDRVVANAGSAAAPNSAASVPGLRLARSEPAPARRSLAPRLRQRALRANADNGQRGDDFASVPSDQQWIFHKLYGGPMPTQTPSIFARLFGSAPKKNVTLAYATSEGGGAGLDGIAADSGNVMSGLYDRQTAVYDISAHTVYLPNGAILEAHSGLGSRLDDARYANERGRGPTPPDIYDLRPRERVFHGVRALRLLPEDQAKVFGRDGLLAHTYMLGPNGQSNGCVSFKNYSAFLQAYENHEITRLAVVAHI
ncbi:MAG: DUF2778 domain-containing protein [Xanthobacteraceae bacterium]